MKRAKLPTVHPGEILLARIIHETEGDDVFWPKVHGEAGGKIDQSPVELLHT
jgi:hypothetical protein